MPFYLEESKFIVCASTFSGAIDFLRTSLLSGKEALELLKLTVLSVQDAEYWNQLSLPHLLSLPYPQEACGTFSRLAVRLCDGMIVAVLASIQYIYYIVRTYILQYSMYVTLLLYIASMYICSYTLLRITIALSLLQVVVLQYQQLQLAAACSVVVTFTYYTTTYSQLVLIL